MDASEPVDLLGAIDVYLFDQLQRRRIRPGMRILDAGCGRGRNLQYFLRAGYDVAGCDPDPAAVEAVRGLAGQHSSSDENELERRFRVETLEDGSFESGSFDAVICNAVLHFARDGDHFRRMLAGAWRPLRAGGLFFVRLASSIGLEDRVEALGSGRFRLPDGSSRFLIDEAPLLRLGTELGGELLDPIKTTNVQGRRCMTTWVLRRAGEA